MALGAHYDCHITQTYLEGYLCLQAISKLIRMNLPINILHQDWKWPTPEELQSYLDRIKATNPRALEAEGLCKGGSLGLYMVRDSRCTG